MDVVTGITKLAEAALGVTYTLDATPASPHYRRQSSGLFRDQPDDTRCAFVVEDGAYVSARWPGDAHLFAQTVAKHVLVGCASAHRAGPGHAMVR